MLFTEASLSHTNASVFAKSCSIRDNEMSAFLFFLSWQNKCIMKSMTKNTLHTAACKITALILLPPQSCLAILACGQRSQAAQLLSSLPVLNHWATPRKISQSEPRAKHGFTTVDILMFKYRREPTHKMAQGAHSFPAEGYSTHPEAFSKNQHVVWQRGTPVNEI